MTDSKKSKITKKKVVIGEDVFTSSIKFFWGYGFKEAYPELTEPPHLRGYTVIDEQKGSIKIRLHKDATIGTLVHEIYHAVSWITRTLGIKQRGKYGGEVMTYMMQYYTNKAVDKLGFHHLRHK